MFLILQTCPIQVSHGQNWYGTDGKEYLRCGVVVTRTCGKEWSVTRIRGIPYRVTGVGTVYRDNPCLVITGTGVLKHY